MGTEGFPRELATQLRQEMTFSLHADPQVKTKQVLEAVVSAISLRDLRSVRPSGLGRFFVTTHTMRAVEKLRAMGALTVTGKEYPLVSLASSMKLITVLHLPTELPDNDLSDVLGRYGRVVKMHREKYRDYPTVETGARKVLLEVSGEVPNFVSVRGFQAMCLYVGMRKVCRRCSMEGHFAADCTTPRCRRCLDYGHEAVTCDERCKKCGADHWTSRCRVPTYASVANEEPTAMAVAGVYTEEMRQQQELLGEGNDAKEDNNVNTEVATASFEEVQDAATPPPAEVAPATAEREGYRVGGQENWTEVPDASQHDQLSKDGSLSSDPPLVIDEDALVSEEEDSNAGPPLPKRPYTSSSSRSSSHEEEWQTVKPRKDHKKPKQDGEKTVIPVPATLSLVDDEGDHH